MLTKKLVATFAMAATLWPCLASAQPATCYYLVTGPDRGWRIRVVWDSGATELVGTGDRLPVGCNVDRYEYVGQPFDCQPPFGAPTSSYPLNPLNCGDTGQFATAACGTVDGGPVQIGAGGLSCGSCPVCGDTDAPDKPHPNDHDDPFGDDDGDGVPNICDPDEVSCDDLNADGCCDECQEGGSACQPPDSDNDGIPDRCDVDSPENYGCEDADENGCCDFCSESECGGDPPGGGNDDDDDEDKNNDGIRDCPEEEGGSLPEPGGERQPCCAEGSPDQDNDGVCDDCDATLYDDPSANECEDANEDGVCDDCEVGDDDCDICGKLDRLIELLGGDIEAPGQASFYKQNNPPTQMPSKTVPSVVTPYYNPLTMYRPLAIPIPGNAAFNYELNSTLPGSGINSSTLDTWFTAFRVTVRNVVLGLFAYRFFFALYRLLASA